MKPHHLCLALALLLIAARDADALSRYIADRIVEHEAIAGLEMGAEKGAGACVDGLCGAASGSEVAYASAVIRRVRGGVVCLVSLSASLSVSLSLCLSPSTLE